METDLISVLIPAYNVEKYLGRCLRSVLKQTYQNLEVVVVDDGSTDDTYLVAKKYADTDQRIILLRKPNQNNVAITRNFLLEHCRGKYCVWVDSDDCIRRNYIEKLYQALTINQADLSVCKFAIRVVPFPLMPMLWTKMRNFAGDELIPQMIYRTGLVLWNKMYRMDIINGAEKLRFDPKYCYGEDLLFNLAYLRRCQKMVYVKNRLYRYSWRAGSEMHKKFSDNHISFMNKLLELCETETNPVIRETLCGWAALSCSGFAFLANRREYPEAVARMKHFAYIYRNDLYKNRLAKLGIKFILWLGLKTWCRPNKTLRLQQKKGN